MTDTPRLPPRPKAAVIFLALPLVFAGALLAALALLFLMSHIGGEATGTRVALRFDGPCAAEALPLVEARAASIGLGEPVFAARDGQLHLTATLPGLPDDMRAMPALLVREGRVEVRQGMVVLANNGDMAKIVLEASGEGSPYTWLGLKPDAATRVAAALEADPEGQLEIVVDGEIVAERPNSISLKNDGLRLVTGQGEAEARMRTAIDWSITLRHGPLPCALQLGHLEALPTDE
jgi:hypothetical protein